MTPDEKHEEIIEELALILRAITAQNKTILSELAKIKEKVGA